MSSDYSTGYSSPYGYTISNSGVRSISTGSTNGTISVDTGGTSAEVAVKGLGSAAYTSSDLYMRKSNPTGTGSMSMNRLADSTTGSYSSTFGRYCTASGSYSFAAGQYCSATGTRSIALGGGSSVDNENQASGSYAFAVGAKNSAEGEGSVCAGYGNIASGIRSIALGYTNSSCGSYSSVAIGSSNIINNTHGVAIGTGNTVNTNYSYCIGRNNTIESASNSAVFGFENSVTHAQQAAYGTVAVGLGLTDTNPVPNSNQVVLGMYGNAYVGSDHCVTIACGTESSRRQAAVFNASKQLIDFKFPICPSNMRTGTVAITPTAANTPTSKAITWDEMDNAPNVITTGVCTGVPGTTVLGTGWTGRSTTGLTLVITRTNTGTTYVSYMAMYYSNGVVNSDGTVQTNGSYSYPSNGNIM